MVNHNNRPTIIADLIADIYLEMSAYRFDNQVCTTIMSWIEDNLCGSLDTQIDSHINTSIEDGIYED